MLPYEQAVFWDLRDTTYTTWDVKVLAWQIHPTHTNERQRNKRNKRNDVLIVVSRRIIVGRRRRRVTAAAAVGAVAARGVGFVTPLQSVAQLARGATQTYSYWMHVHETQLCQRKRPFNKKPTFFVVWHKCACVERRGQGNSRQISACQFRYRCMDSSSEHALMNLCSLWNNF